MLASGVPSHRLPTPPLDDEIHPWFRPGGMKVLHYDPSPGQSARTNSDTVNGFFAYPADSFELARSTAKTANGGPSRYSQLLASKFGAASKQDTPQALQTPSYNPLDAICDSAEHMTSRDTVINRQFASQSYVKSPMPSGSEKDNFRQFLDSHAQTSLTPLQSQSQTNPYPQPPPIAIYPATDFGPWEQQQPLPAADVIADFRSMVADRLANVYSGFSDPSRIGQEQATRLASVPNTDLYAPMYASKPAVPTGPSQHPEAGQQFDMGNMPGVSYWTPSAQSTSVSVPKTPYEQLLEAKLGRPTGSPALSAPTIETMTGGEAPSGAHEHLQAMHRAAQFRMQSRDPLEMWKHTRQSMVPNLHCDDGMPTGTSQWATTMYYPTSSNERTPLVQVSTPEGTPTLRTVSTPLRPLGLGTLPPTPVLGRTPMDTEPTPSAKSLATVYDAAWEAFARGSADQCKDVPSQLQISTQHTQQPIAADYTRPTFSQYPPTPATPHQQPLPLPLGAYPTPQYTGLLQPTTQPYFSPMPSQQSLPRSPAMDPSSPTVSRYHEDSHAPYGPEGLTANEADQVPMWQIVGSRSPLPTNAPVQTHASGSGSGGEGGYGAGDLGGDASGLPLGTFIGGDGYGNGGQDYGNGNGDGHGLEGNGNGDGNDGHGHPQEVPRKLTLACHFCRGRKLKCDGVRPTCAHCNKRGLECSYDATVRRRGPGKRNKEDKEKGEGGSRGKGRKRSKAADDIDSDPSKRLRTEEVAELDLVDPALADLEPLRLAALASQDGYVHADAYHDHEQAHHDDVPVDPALLGAHLH